MKKAETVVIGATCYAVGYAIANAGCVILEEGQWAGFEFSECMNGERADLTIDLQTESKQLVDDLKGRGLLDETGNVHILPIAEKMCGILLEKKVETFLDTQVIDVIEKKDGYAITIFGRSGFEEWQAKRVIDTRTIADKANKKFYATSVRNAVGENLTGGKLLQGTLGDWIIKVYLDKCVPYAQARREVEKFVANNLQNVQIYAFANEFGYEYKTPYVEKIKENYRVVCSASFGDFLSAFDAGVKAGKEDGKAGDL